MISRLAEKRSTQDGMLVYMVDVTDSTTVTTVSLTPMFLSGFILFDVCQSRSSTEDSQWSGARAAM